MTSEMLTQTPEAKRQAWFIDTSALVTLAVHLPLQQTVVTSVVATLLSTS